MKIEMWKIKNYLLNNIYYDAIFIGSFNLDYGMLHRRTCLKFLIEKYDSSQNTYIGHMDGKLYMNDTDEPYDFDKYCIEIIKDGSEENVMSFQFFLFSFSFIHSYICYLSVNTILCSLFTSIYCFLITAGNIYLFERRTFA